MPPRSVDRYAIAAPIYDIATAGWSGGAIWRTRAAALLWAAPGVSFLVPGPGTGRLAVEAAALGADVTVVERSPTMLGRLRRRAKRRGVRLTDHPGDIRDFDAGARFDVVAAEHFLNVFGPGEMPAVRDHLIDRLAPEGTLVIADFTPLVASGPSIAGRLARGLQRLHHGLPLGGCALLTANAMHPIYDHGQDLDPHPELVLVAMETARSFGVGPGWFCAWTFRRCAQGEPLR